MFHVTDAIVIGSCTPRTIHRVMDGMKLIANDPAVRDRWINRLTVLHTRLPFLTLSLSLSLSLLLSHAHVHTFTSVYRGNRRKLSCPYDYETPWHSCNQQSCSHEAICTYIIYIYINIFIHYSLHVSLSLALYGLPPIVKYKFDITAGSVRVAYTWYFYSLAPWSTR